jgi:uncharacterized protein involved in cysteine biosynthesis
MLTPLARAIAQIDDLAFLKVILASLLLSALSFAALCIGSLYGLHHALSAHGWLGWLAGALGGLAAAAIALWLFLPVAVLIASLFLEPICRAVERRWYPGLPVARGAPLAVQLWDGLAVGFRVLVYSLLSLLLALLIPGIGLVLGWAITAWALGRGLFVAVAMRRMSRREATRAYQAERWLVLAQGSALAIAATVPLLNLLVPVIGTAAMVHVLARLGRS